MTAPLDDQIDSHADAMARDAAVAASLALQRGTPLETLRRALLRDPHGVASGPLGAALDLIAKNGGSEDGDVEGMRYRRRRVSGLKEGRSTAPPIQK